MAAKTNYEIDKGRSVYSELSAVFTPILNSSVMYSAGEYVLVLQPSVITQI